MNAMSAAIKKLDDAREAAAAERVLDRIALLRAELNLIFAQPGPRDGVSGRIDEMRLHMAGLTDRLPVNPWIAARVLTLAAELLHERALDPHSLMGSGPVAGLVLSVRQYLNSLDEEQRMAARSSEAR